MGTNRKRRPGLTSRVVRGLWRALTCAEAAMPSNLTGYDDTESNIAYEEVKCALRWLAGLEHERARARRRRR